jgi:hypothetical protein
VCVVTTLFTLLPRIPQGKQHPSRVLVLTSVIPATQEAEIGRIVVRSQTRVDSSRDPISKKNLHKKGLVEWLKV